MNLTRKRSRPAQTEIKPTENQKNELPTDITHLRREAEIYLDLPRRVKKCGGGITETL